MPILNRVWTGKKILQKHKNHARSFFLSEKSFESWVYVREYSPGIASMRLQCLRDIITRSQSQMHYYLCDERLTT